MTDETEVNALRSGGEEKNGVGVKPLGEWRRGYCDERVTIQQASFGGMYQVRVLDGVVWLDWPTRTAEEFETVDLAKAAAQADYEQNILSALTNTDLSLRAENERLRKEREEAAKVLEPFANVRDQYPESVKLINGKLDGFTLMSVSVTKDQFIAAHAFLSNLKGAE